jgi:hypothetical protein
MANTETVLEFWFAEYRYSPDGSTARLTGNVPPLATVDAAESTPLVGVIEYEERELFAVTFAA